jgi:fatty-acyl-CoA synthase
MDAIVVGLPNDRFGEVVVALVEPKPGSAFDPGDLIAHVRVHLAPYKAPRHVLTVPAVTRADNGKVDYPGMRAIAAQLLGVEIAT